MRLLNSDAWKALPGALWNLDGLQREKAAKAEKDEHLRVYGGLLGDIGNEPEYQRYAPIFGAARQGNPMAIEMAQQVLGNRVDPLDRQLKEAQIKKTLADAENTGSQPMIDYLKAQLDGRRWETDRQDRLADREERNRQWEYGQTEGRQRWEFEQNRMTRNDAFAQDQRLREDQVRQSKAGAEIEEEIGKAQAIIEDIQRARHIQGGTTTGFISGSETGSAARQMLPGNMGGGRELQELQRIYSGLGLERVAQLKGASSDKDLQVAFRAGPNLQNDPMVNDAALARQEEVLKQHIMRMQARRNPFGQPSQQGLLGQPPQQGLPSGYRSPRVTLQR